MMKELHTFSSVHLVLDGSTQASQTESNFYLLGKSPGNFGADMGITKWHKQFRSRGFFYRLFGRLTPKVN